MSEREGGTGRRGERVEKNEKQSGETRVILFKSTISHWNIDKQGVLLLT